MKRSTTRTLTCLGLAGMALLSTANTAQAKPLPTAEKAGFGFGPGSPGCPPDATLHEVLVPDPNNPHKYFKCGFFFKGKFTCPDNGWFDLVLEKCVASKPEESTPPPEENEPPEAPPPGQEEPAISVDL